MIRRTCEVGEQDVELDVQVAAAALLLGHAVSMQHALRVGLHLIYGQPHWLAVNAGDVELASTDSIDEWDHVSHCEVIFVASEYAVRLLFNLENNVLRRLTINRISGLK